MAYDCLRYNDALTTVSLPALTTMDNYCLSYNDALTTVSLPALTTMDNDCLSYNDALTTVSLPVLTTMDNYCLSYNDALTTVSLPALTAMGNYCLSYNDALTTVSLPALTTMDNYCLRKNQALTTVSLKNEKLNVKNVDGSCFVVEQTKNSKGIKIYSGYNLIEVNKGDLIKEFCFVSEKENFFAHGKTVKKSIEDLNFKIISEKLKKDPINKDTVITINYYRIITGACEQGVNSWIKQHGITKTKYKAIDLLPLLEKTGAYGVEKFKSLITF